VGRPQPRSSGTIERKGRLPGEVVDEFRERPLDLRHHCLALEDKTPWREMSNAIRVSPDGGPSASRISGPSYAQPSYVLACGKYSGFSPSMSRLLMSLPIV
jgi:hypothetical protein